MQTRQSMAAMGHDMARVVGPDITVEDETAIMRVARHDLRQFAPLYDAYFPRIYAYCQRRVATRQDAEDLTSQIFTRALKGIAGFRGGSVAAWLFRIARHAVANHHRGRRIPVALDEIEIAAESTALLDQLAHAEDITRVRQLVEDLPDDERELIELRLYDGLKTKEIAQIVGKREGAVKMRLSRLYKRLRVHFLEDSL
jgi:RNA polymerase sigma-70 factor (ECF subfamily)